MKMFTFTPSVPIYIYINQIYQQLKSSSISVKFYFNKNGVHRPFFYFFCISTISRPPAEPSACIEECIRTFPKRSTRAGVQLNKCPADLVSAMLDMLQKKQAIPIQDDSQSTCSARPAQDALKDGLVSEAGSTVVAPMPEKVQPAPLMDEKAPMPEKVQPAAPEELSVVVGSLETASLKAMAENANKKSKKRAVGDMLDDLKKAYVKDNVARKAAREEPDTVTETSSKKKKKEEEIKETMPSKNQKKKGGDTRKEKEEDEQSKKKEIQKKEEGKKKNEEKKPEMKRDNKKKKITENPKGKEVASKQIEKTQEKAKKPVEKAKAMKPALKMDKKNYCSRAYHKMFDQKVKEGMDPQDAKFEARKAHRAATTEWHEKYEGTVG